MGLAISVTSAERKKCLRTWIFADENAVPLWNYASSILGDQQYFFAPKILPEKRKTSRKAQEQKQEQPVENKTFKEPLTSLKDHIVALYSATTP